ncbi:relaxase/mobilization nuclease domain-containing protein [Pseudooceanicola spongiae]|uniref:Relaxase/mobilization nuclease domain-containing protein n=1 Tax=Pseudooceanicola spongiae TaxID=2613965 RepID=A0A7L9WRU4_9RHOB|nr:relaxase/mobilization nuclease domain-containing protein [Pseudooceanicola spongiae]
MIGKIRKGDTFGGLARYLTEDGRGRVLALDNLSSDSVAAAASEMTIAAATSRRTQKPVLHLSISYAEGEIVSTDQMRHDARRVLRALGLKGHQAVILAHDDTDHPHLHVMACRVGPTGKSVSDSRSYSRVEAALREIETVRGWNSVLGRHAPSPATGQRMTGHRKSRYPRQHRVPDQVRQSLLNAGSWAELHQGVRSAGWRLEVVQKGRGSGALLVGPDGERVAAGEVDRGATLTRLRRRLGRHPETQKRALAKLAQSRTKGPGRAPFSTGHVLAVALRQMLTHDLTPTLRPRRSGPRLPGLPRL